MVRERKAASLCFPVLGYDTLDLVRHVQYSNQDYSACAGRLVNQTMDYNIPSTMKQLVVDKPGPTVEKCQVSIREVPVPQPGANQVLVKVVAAAVNPSDYLDWINAIEEKCPLPMGKEGSGIVVQIGKGGMYNAIRRVKLGMQVGFVGLKENQGSYSEYVLVNTALDEGFFPLPKDLPLPDAASFFVNPYTAVAILETVKQSGNKAFVHTAAASQLGQMIIQLAPTYGIDVICMVRREEQAAILKQLGAKHVVVTGKEEESVWMKELQDKITKLSTNVAFDAVAGRLSGLLLDAIPDGGTVYVYGCLAGRCEHVDPLKLQYAGKQLKGFLLPTWLQSGNLAAQALRLQAASEKVNSGLQKGGWASSQFQDTTIETVQKDIVALLGTNITGTKLRVRLDDPETETNTTK